MELVLLYIVFSGITECNLVLGVVQSYSAALCLLRCLAEEIVLYFQYNVRQNVACIISNCSYCSGVNVLRSYLSLRLTQSTIWLGLNKGRNSIWIRLATGSFAFLCVSIH